ncbi:MAG TPA: M48 family metallopeptidase [Candidatus Thermoplasmatota archaeon]|nr:M48 family metallopeptidase [Candidatus Thermoplasmatota archaeon]
MEPTPNAPRLGFEAHIRKNQWLTFLVLGFMFLLLFGAIFAAGYLLGTPPYVTAILALVGAGIYLVITATRSVSTVLLATRARPANPALRAEKLLIYKVEEMAIAAGISPPPKVYVQDSRDINAYAAGLRLEEAVVCVTTGALEQLDQEELEGVIAHEMAHILNRDIRLATITIAVVGSIAMVAEIGIRLMGFGAGRRGRDREGGHPLILVLAIIFLILAPLFSRLAYLLISRKREYLADATGAQLTRNPEGLARALEKIKGDLPDHPVGSRTAASLYIANPWTRKSFNTAFSTHPPLEDRIARLRQM